MFVNPREAIEQGWIKFPDHFTEADKEKCIQPNAIDFTVDRLFQIAPAGVFVISEDLKIMKNQTEMYATPQPLIHEQSGWVLSGGAFDFLSDFYIKVPDGVAAYLVPRSTFVRNGVTVTSGLYDTGFEGNVGGVIFCNGNVAAIGKGTRIGQLIFVRSDTSGKTYAGGYNGAVGQHWTAAVEEKAAAEPEVTAESTPEPEVVPVEVTPAVTTGKQSKRANKGA